VPWDLRISREHADLVLEGQVLRVRRLATARNSIYFRGEPVDEFLLEPGEDFRIGQTVFRLAALSSGRADASRPSSVSQPSPAGAANLWLDAAGASERERLQLLLAQLEDDSTCLEPLGDTPPNVRSPAIDPMHDLDGNVLGLYELTEPLHRSVTGQILKVRHQYLDRWSALQILASAASSAQAVARFHRKAQLTAAFDHENVVRTFEGGRIGDLHYLIMEYIDGWTLAELLGHQRLAVEATVDYVIQAARGLAHAHQRQVVHRDVTPAHLMLTSRAAIKVMGWSRAARLGPHSLSVREDDGQDMGTPGFMAPEQFVPCGHVDPRTDVYGLGCTLYALLASQTLLPPDWQFAKTAGEAEPNAPPLRNIRTGIPGRLEAVYQKMLAPAPENRWASMAEVIDALQALR
jgi:serine/threonine protein kinase